MSPVQTWTWPWDLDFNGQSNKHARPIGETSERNSWALQAHLWHPRGLGPLGKIKEPGSFTSFHCVSSNFSTSFGAQRSNRSSSPKKLITHLKTATNSGFSQLSFSAARVTTSTWRGNSQILDTFGSFFLHLFPLVIVWLLFLGKMCVFLALKSMIHVHECMIHLEYLWASRLVCELERVCICLCKYMPIWLYVRYVPLWSLESLSDKPLQISSKQCGNRPFIRGFLCLETLSLWQTWLFWKGKWYKLSIFPQFMSKFDNNQFSESTKFPHFR